MGFLIDIAEIAGLLFVAYMAGWLVGYLAHRLTARAPARETAAPAREQMIAQAPPADALVKAPVVVPVATTPPPQLLAAATAIQPVKATAVPDTDDPEPQPEPAPVPPPVVSALDTLKSLSTAMPLVAAVEPPQAVEAVPTIAVEAVPIVAVEAVPASAAVDPQVDEAMEPSAAEETAPPVSAEPIAVVPPLEPLPPPEPAAPPQRAPSEPALPPAADPVLPVPPSAERKVEVVPVSVKPSIRVAPATRAGEIAARPTQAAPEPEPPPADEPIPAALPTPASAPGVPWAGAIKGHEARKFAPEAGPGLSGVSLASEPDESIEEPDAALDVALLSSIADQLKLDPAASGTGDSDDIPAVIEPPAPLALTPMEVGAIEPPTPQLSEPPAPEPIAPSSAASAEPPRSPPPPRGPTLDEDAAMRAIEGGWSRRDVRALGDAPEMTDVSAAVSAAQVAVEQVLARNGVDAAEPEVRVQASFGKPAGLPQPRDGRRDSLKRIDGLGPLDEVTLNNLGIYHFDQIAKWTEREVLWLENHAFAVGRIAREDWQDQARELIAERDATRALR